MAAYWYRPRILGNIQYSSYHELGTLNMLYPNPSPWKSRCHTPLPRNRNVVDSDGRFDSLCSSHAVRVKVICITSFDGISTSFWPDLSIKSRCYWSSILSVNVFPFHAFNTFTVCTRGGWNSAIWGNYLLSTLILIKAKSKSVAFRTILKVASLILLKLF